LQRLGRKPGRRTYAFDAPLVERPPGAPNLSHWVVASGRRIPLQHGANLIGRDPAAAIHLDVPGVSRRHARIVVDDGGAELEDLGSKNGTSVVDTALTGPVRLQDGDRVCIGPAILVFHASATGMSTETASRARPAGAHR
jgi:pSer/pThr/pTyr-binding forkhead associated (FHA) protein